MSLQAQTWYLVPEETGRVARAAFPKGNSYVRMYDELGVIYDDHQFAALFSQRGQPVVSPVRLALATILQFPSVLAVYRQWACAHPIDFQLIYGHPVLGYPVPRAHAIQAGASTLQTPMRLVDLALKTGEIHCNLQRIPSFCAEALHAMRVNDGDPISEEARYVMMTLWPQLYGLILLELEGYLPTHGGSAEALYHHCIQEMLHAWRVDDWS